MVRNDIKMMQIQGELFYLRDKALPLADTMPNFALESQGKSSFSSDLSDKKFTLVS